MTVEEFELMLKEDPEKEKLFRAALDSEEARNSGSDAAAYSLAASRVGVEIAPEAVERHFAELCEVDEDELKHVGGGLSKSGQNYKNGHDNNCAVAYHCYTVTLHPSDTGHDADTACWSDWGCMVSEHKHCGSGFVSCFDNVTDMGKCLSNRN